MGCPLSRFSVFASFCKDDNPTVRKVLDQFKLTAVVLNEPDDWGFARVLESNFNFLDRTTGNQLLFITFTNKNFGRLRRKRDVYCHSEQNDKDLLWNDTDIDEANFLDMLRFFDVRSDQLPLVILTNDLSKGDCFVINTSCRDISDQLFELTKFCEEQEGRVDLSDPKFLSLIESLDRNARRSKLRSNFSIAKMLADVFARVKIQRKSFIPDFQAEKWITDNMEKSEAILNAMEQGVDYSDNDREEELHNYYINLLARRLKGLETGFQDNNGEFCIDIAQMEGSEYDSLVAVKEYNRFVSSMESLMGLDEEDHQWVLNAIMLQIGKVFELELNASLVQLMRKCVGIPMPDCYCKPFFSRDGYKVETGVDGSGVQRYVDLNAVTNDGKWMSLYIGSARYAYNALEEKIMGMECFKSDDLFTTDSYRSINWHGFQAEFVHRLWPNINYHRNQNAHRLTQNDFRDFFESFCEVLQRGYYQDLMSFKKMVCGRGHWERNLRRHMDFYSPRR